MCQKDRKSEQNSIKLLSKFFRCIRKPPKNYTKIKNITITKNEYIL